MELKTSDFRHNVDTRTTQRLLSKRIYINFLSWLHLIGLEIPQENEMIYYILIKFP